LKKLIFILLILILVSCKVTQPAEKADFDSILNSPKPQILFLDLFFRYDSLLNKSSAGLINIKIVPGSLKTDFDSKEKAEKGDVIISFTDDKLNHLKTIIIDNSFILKNEYSDEDGTLVWAESKVTEREYSLRTRFASGSSYIIVKLLDKNNGRDTIELMKINLKEIFNENAD